MDFATSMVVGSVESALSAIFQQLLDKFALPFLDRLGFLFGVEEEAKKLKSILSRIEALLADAEEKQIKEELVRLWLSELKDVAYDAEDILDELEYVVLRSKLEEPKRDQVSDLFSRSVSNLNLGPRMKEMRERLEEIESRSNHLHLKVIRKSERLVPGKRPPTSSIVDASIVFGREADKAKVVRLLTSDDSLASDSGIQVVPICGMGGLGKTTLAQLAYNDEHVVKHFEVKAWVYVSEDFNLIRLANAIVKSVTGSDPHLTDSDPFQVSIKEALEGKKFLLVLDDVWNDTCNDWDALRAPLMFGARGSRILVTTRSRRVSQRVSQRLSSNTGAVPTHFLQGLSDDDSWSLFERRAFVDGDSDAHPDLVKIGKEIVNKCNGLPLAVKTLGGLLCSVVDVVQWEKILKSEIWELPEEGNDILPALRLSYHHLPAHLKRCFAYCGCVVHKGQWGVQGDKLILKWMAQGFIQPSEQMGDIGREYLADLVSRSLLNCRIDEIDESSYYTMHDLTHDLARSVLGTDFWKIGHEKSHGNNAEKARYMSDDPIISCSFEDFYCLKNLRTLSVSLFSTENIPADLFINLRHIRTLRLSGRYITELPESIGDLLQLRYLDLSWCKNIVRLPKSTTRLYNLQTLILDYCWKLVGLPSDLSNLVNLRHLHPNSSSVSTPPRIGTLKGLQKLSHFNVGKEIGRGINELKDLIHLRGRLCISKLENVVNVEEAKEAQLKNKQKIDELKLQWKSCDDLESRQEGIEEEVLNALQPHTNLKELYIEGYCGIRFPTWLGDSSFSKLTEVNLTKCRCRLLPPFGGLPSLKRLSLAHLYELKKVGREFYGDGTMTGLPPLESLSFTSMPDLEELSGLESVTRFICTINISKCNKLSLSSLRYLTSVPCLDISSCSNLTSLWNGLQHLTSLQSLSIEDCPELTSLYDVDLPATLDDGLGNSNYSNPPTCLLKGLKKLTLWGCPKIPSLPEELLTTLWSLDIRDCPLLVEKYLVLAEGGNGYRCKISHIPDISFKGWLRDLADRSLFLPLVVVG